MAPHLASDAFLECCFATWISLAELELIENAAISLSKSTILATLIESSLNWSVNTLRDGAALGCNRKE